MKRIFLFCFLFLLSFSSASATLTTIGTARYNGVDYRLIYDDDDTGHGGGGLVWLDALSPRALEGKAFDVWTGALDWASGIGSHLTVTLTPGYITDIDWSTGWRLPDTVDAPLVFGNEGDPDRDGIYNYTEGYNLANSEMGHLFYTELGNLGANDTSGNSQPGYGLVNTGDFENLISGGYWSSTECENLTDTVWFFHMGFGLQGTTPIISSHSGIAVHSGVVSSVPAPNSIILLGLGLLGFAGISRRKKSIH